MNDYINHKKIREKSRWRNEENKEWETKQKKIDKKKKKIDEEIFWNHFSTDTQYILFGLKIIQFFEVI